MDGLVLNRNSDAARCCSRCSSIAPHTHTPETIFAHEHKAIRCALCNEKNESNFEWVAASRECYQMRANNYIVSSSWNGIFFFRVLLFINVRSNGVKMNKICFHIYSDCERTKARRKCNGYGDEEGEEEEEEWNIYKFTILNEIMHTFAYLYELPYCAPHAFNSRQTETINVNRMHDCDKCYR